MRDGDPQSTAQPPTSARARGRFHWPTFAADAVLVTGGALVANILNYVFHFALSRKLGPDSYGSLAALLAIAMVAGVVGSSIGTIAMQETARLWASHRDADIASFGRGMLRWAIGAGAVVAGIILLASIPLSGYLHISDALAWLSLSIALFIAIVAAYARGAIQGAHRFGIFAASLVTESALKLLFGILLASAGLAVGGAMGGVAIGLAAGTAVAVLPLVRGASALPDRLGAAQYGASALQLAVIYAASMALLFVDTVFAKHALAGDQAGYYSAAGLVARIIPFGVGLIVPLVTPKAVAALHHDRSALAHLLAVTFGAAIVGTVAVLAVAEVWPHALIAVTFGPKFAPAAPLLRWYAIDTSLIAVGFLGYTYLAAVGEYRVAAWLVATLALEAVCMAIWGDSPARLLGIAICGNALVLPAIATFVARTLRDAPQQPQAPSPPLAEDRVSP